MSFCKSVLFRRFVPVLGLIVACHASGENGDKPADGAPAGNNASGESAQAVPENPYAGLEQIASADFHNRVVRADRAKKSMDDTMDDLEKALDDPEVKKQMEKALKDLSK